MKALIVDDSTTMRMVISRAFKAEGWEIKEARNGKEALAILAQESAWDLVLLDWNMPEMNGLEFVKEARANSAYAKIPIVMVTSDSAEINKQACLAAGATDFISKPFAWESLTAALNKVKR